MTLDLDQLDLVVQDMEATVAFYRALGVDIPEEAIWRTPSGIHHVDITMPSGLVFHFDSPALTKAYDRGWEDPKGTGTRNVFSFKVPSREEVDRLHGEMTSLGHPSAQTPYDTFWGARYAIREDPDGNHIGIMSPADPALRSAPPDL